MSEPTHLSAETFIKQTAFGDPDGNCLEACLASLTRIPLEDIPHFLQYAWFFHYKQWFRERGWHIKHFDSAAPFPGFAIASGPAERGIDHSCVYLDGKLFHDPHPSNAGLLSVTDYILVWPTFEAQAAQAAEIAALKGQRDKAETTLEMVNALATGYGWLSEGRGMYAYDDGRYDDDVRTFVGQLLELMPSGNWLGFPEWEAKYRAMEAEIAALSAALAQVVTQAPRAWR